MSCAAEIHTDHDVVRQRLLVTVQAVAGVE
jgi:hypothetical protein